MLTALIVMIVLAAVVGAWVDGYFVGARNEARWWFRESKAGRQGDDA